MTIRPMTEEDWVQVWPIFDEIVQAGETYAYPTPAPTDPVSAEPTPSTPPQQPAKKVYPWHDIVYPKPPKSVMNKACS